ncbi:hypothetical protein [Flagellimonas eckloniae]|uniref:Lipoprotein n=1 Tax=Flagellimonas eckloniae TaxID=346185 RepID=A0A0Q0XLV6_9FLAO|nr:hypothetical protein [Allomuricauda eckloniae]KQC30007.1 hypothetical protein AAY42_09045 [Allomuricauda eckloniae]
MKVKKTMNVLILFISIGCADLVREYPNGIKYISEGLEYNFVTKDGTSGFFLESNIIGVKESSQYLLFVQMIDSKRLEEKLGRDIFPNIKNLDSIDLKHQVDSVLKKSSHLSAQLMHEKDIGFYT